MNKKLKVILIIVVIMLMALICGILIKKIGNNTGISEEVNKKILIEYAHVNHAWGFQYMGQAIFDDGTIYEWDNEGKSFSEEKQEWIPRHGTLKKAKVSSDDLKKLVDYINGLEDSFIYEKSSWYDFGVSYVTVWDYSNNREITLKQYGDVMGENKTENSQKILEIVSKYIQ